MKEAHQIHILDLFHQHQPSPVAFWTMLRRARLCPNCDAVFDSSFTFCPCCGAQHLFDTISLLQLLNQEEIFMDKEGKESVAPIQYQNLIGYTDEQLRRNMVYREDAVGAPPWFSESEEFPSFWAGLRSAWREFWKRWRDHRHHRAAAKRLKKGVALGIVATVKGQEDHELD